MMVNNMLVTKPFYCFNVRTIITSAGMLVDHSNTTSFYKNIFVGFSSYQWKICSAKIFYDTALCIFQIYACHTLEYLLYVHIFTLLSCSYCTHCSITIEDWLKLLVMVDWRMSRYFSRMEQMLMGSG